MFFQLLTPLTPKSKYHLISPYNITPESHVKVTRVKEMIVKKILLVSTLGSVWRTVWRIHILM